MTRLAEPPAFSAATGHVQLPASPQALRDRQRVLSARRADREQGRRRLAEQLRRIEEYLGISDAVNEALDKLSQELFARTVKILEENLTRALQEVLEQP